MPRSRLEIALGLAILAIFAGGVVRLFQLRLASGDVHPPGSSYRSDPLGARALHDALVESGRIRVVRNLEDASRLRDGEGRTLLWLAAGAGGQGALAPADAVPDGEIEAVEAFARSGGRVVVAFRPATVRPAILRRALRGTRFPPPGTPGAPEPPSTWYDALESWEASLEFEPLDYRGSAFVPVEGTLAAEGFEEFAASRPASGSAIPTAISTTNANASATTGTLAAAIRRLPPIPAGTLPSTLSLRSGLVLDLGDPTPWRPIYSRGERPVVVERALGEGSLVVVADASLLSNEAMWRERRSDFVSWLVGPSREVVFEETHLGVVSRPGMAALARRLRLEYAGLALLAFGALFVWRTALPLAPRLPDEEAGRADSALAERDAHSGLASLLRRAIPRDRLVEACLTEWRRSHPGRVVDSRAPLELAREAAAAASGGSRPSPEAVYRELARLLEPRGGQTPGASGGSNRRGNAP